MYRISCSEVWGGIESINIDLCSNGITASIFSNSCDGDRGGDVYYFSLCSEDQITRIAVADVVGHGQAVSEISQWFFEALKRHINIVDNTGLLTNINQIAHQRGLEAMTTAAVINYYTESAMLSFSYAGHPPFIWRDQEKRWQLLNIDKPNTRPANLPLGVMAEVSYDQEQVKVNPGDRLIVYTDGVIDSTDAEGRFFGQEGLLRVLTEAREDSLKVLKEQLLQALEQHTGGDMNQDDITFMIVEIN